MRGCGSAFRKVARPLITGEAGDGYESCARLCWSSPPPPPGKNKEKEKKRKRHLKSIEQTRTLFNQAFESLPLTQISVDLLLHCFEAEKASWISQTIYSRGFLPPLKYLLRSYGYQDRSSLGKWGK